MAQEAQIKIVIDGSQATKSIGNLQTELKKANSELDKAIKLFGSNSKEADKARKSVAGLEIEIGKLNIESKKAVTNQKSLKQELRQLQTELAGLEPGSARFKELSLRASELKEKIEDANAIVNILAGNTSERLIRGIGSAVQVGVAGFQAMSSAQALFGVENEQLQQTLVRMGALLNLSQALETFAGLDQKLVEIKASFTPILTQLGLLKTTQGEVAVVTAAADAALVGESIAADGAAVSTGAFATALNALPLVAVITSIGLLVAGLISYAMGESEADKAAQRRLKTLKAQREEEDLARKTIAAESAEFVGLIYQLKATNAGSKERQTLIKKINDNYGTTLKNISDEKKFQEQLNLEVANYIAFQKAKFQLQKNETLITKNLEKQDKINKEILKVKNKIRAEESIVLGQDDLRAGKIQQNLRDYNSELVKLQGELDAANKRLENYGKVAVDVNSVITEVTDGNKKYGEQVDKTSNSVKGATDAEKEYSDILSKISEEYKTAQSIEEETTKKRIENIDTYLNADDEARKRREENARKTYEEIRVQIEKEITDNTKKQELLRKNEVAFTEILRAESEKRITETQIDTIKLLKEYTERYKYLVAQSKALQDEIQFGEGNTNDTLIGLDQRRTQLLLNELDQRLVQSKYQNQLELQDYTEVLQTRLGVTLQFLEQEKQIAQQTADAEYQRQYELEKLKYDLTKDFIIKETTDANGLTQIKLELKNQEYKRISELNDEAREKERQKLVADLEAAKDDVEKIKAEEALNTYNQNVLLADEIYEIGVQTQKNINKTSENLLEESNVKKLEAVDDYNTKVKDITIQTEDEILDEKLKRLDQFLAALQEQFQQASSVISQFAAQQQEIRTTQLEDAIALDRERIESQFAANLISREQYDNAVEQLEQQQRQKQLQIDRKNFRTQKALNIVGATIDGARGVLSTFANTPGGIIIKSVAAALAAAFAATQIALISRQEFRAATGGIVPGNGSGEIDSVPAKLAPGEAVINARSTQDFLPLLSAINSYDGNGRSFVPDLPATNQSQRFAPVFVENQNREPVRAYVVESDITNAQRRISRIERSTRF